MFDQLRIIDRENVSIRGFDIDHQVSRLGGDWIDARRKFCSVIQIDRSRCFFRIAEARSIKNHLTLIACSEEGETFLRGRTLESKKAITIDSRITEKQLLQLVAAHAFHRITPEAFDGSDHAHGK